MSFPFDGSPSFCGKRKIYKSTTRVNEIDKSIILVTQKNSDIDEPESKDLFQYGCLSKILQLLKLPDGTVKVLVEGEKRVKILSYETE